MSHPITNVNVPGNLACLPLTDEEGKPVIAYIVKTTWNVSQTGLKLADQQEPANLSGEYNFSADEGSYLYEPETAFVKSTTDIALIGHAYAPNARAASVDVGLKMGGLQKVIRVSGDRYWVKKGGHTFATKPQEFEKIPLVYERAFGGWDRADKDENNWRYEPRNPVGVGFGDPLRFVEEGKVPMPNIEDPQHLITRYGDTPPPAGFGFTSPNWHPRAQYAGTYDEEWDKTRKPLLPKDFDRRFFNAASPGLIAPGYLRGDEDVMIVNASPVPKLKFKLPGIPAPVCKVELRGGRTEVLHTNLDTVIINTDEMLVFLLWRNYMHVPNGPHDVVSIEVTTQQELKTAATV